MNRLTRSNLKERKLAFIYHIKYGGRLIRDSFALSQDNLLQLAFEIIRKELNLVELKVSDIIIIIIQCSCRAKIKKSEFELW